MTILICTYLAFIGAAMGSFAGAVAWRLEKKRDFVRERSECEHCHHQLAWYDLVPVVSWLWLKGRCRYCKQPIGVSALLLEIGVSAAFVVSFVAWPYGWSAAGGILFVAWLLSIVMLTILFVYDVRHYLLPDVVMWPLIAAGCVMFGSLMVLRDAPFINWVVEAGFALLPVTGVYGLLYVVSGGRWIGFGDVKLGIFMGLVLLWQGGLLALLLANYLGFFWVLPRLLSGKLRRDMHMPFGPFLIAATFIVFLWGETLIEWLMNFLMV